MKYHTPKNQKKSLLPLIIIALLILIWISNENTPSATQQQDSTYSHHKNTQNWIPHIDSNQQFQHANSSNFIARV